MMEAPTGKVWLVGAGPGDSGLLTLKGRQVLKQGEVILYDSLVSESILAWMPVHAERIAVGKRAGNHLVPQESINRLLLEKAMQGKRVVRLKGGDPFLFGRGGEELELLAEHQIPFEIVPGVSSALAVPAYAGIPVTHRELASSLHIITGHKKHNQPLPLDYDSLVRLGGTLVFLMGVHTLPEICKGLLGAGMPPETPAAFLENGTLSNQRRVVSELGRLEQDSKQAQMKPPAVLIVGAVCALSQMFSWADQRLLSDVRVIVTRPAERASSLTQPLQELGAEVLELPAIQTVPRPDTPDLLRMLDRLPHYDWMVFTSPAGVDVFFAFLYRNRVDMRSLHALKFAAIGPATARMLEQRGIFADLIPDTYDAHALAQALQQAVQPGEKLCIPRAKEGTEQLTKPLQQAGIPFDDVPLYDTVQLGHAPVALRETDLIVFTSASTVKGFVQAMQGTDLRGVQAVCIGEQTARQARHHNMKTAIAEQATIPSLIDCVVACHLQRKKGCSL